MTYLYFSFEFLHVFLFKTSVIFDYRVSRDLLIGFWHFPRIFWSNCIDIQSENTNKLWERTKNLWVTIKQLRERTQKSWELTNKSWKPCK